MHDKDYATPFAIMHAASLLSHKERLRKFGKAIKNAVCEESYVVDLGTGTGILALMAAQAGAKGVVGVDINSDVIAYARIAAKNNGLENRVNFVVSHFADFIPNEQADVVLCEMLSSIMLVEQQVHACKHATEKILTRNGVILPSNAEVYLAPVECKSIWERFQCERMTFPRLPQTINKSEARELANFTLLKRFDFASRDLNPEVDEVVKFEIDEGGIVHGLAGAFQARLDDQILLTMEDGWKDLFLPLEKPVTIERDSILEIRVTYTAGMFDTLKLVPL